ncbi:MAG: phosphoribosyl-ATP diphosphatase [Planctomycetota bacterium]|jgi:phosphoribosyl-ATP pyrophosphohydrolase
MIVPSIDIIGGKAVQLRQGKEHVLTSDRDPVELAAEFNRYGEVAVIDLDAALGKGDNIELIRKICRVADCRVGGGIRDRERGQELLGAGASRIIIGTSAEPELLKQFKRERVIVALDHRGGEVQDKGWTRGTGESIRERAARLTPYCGEFLVTFIEDEGGMGGMDLGAVEEFKSNLGLPITVAGGIATTEEVVEISRLGLDVQVGMALYTGKLDLAESVIGSIDFEKSALVPTIVQDTMGQVLMLAYSSPDSLGRALRAGKGIYYSRSRKEIWEKGLTSGNMQELVSCRTDCDRDTLLFTVRQTGPACHTEKYSCFGRRKFSIPYLMSVLKERKKDLPDWSYSAKLFQNRKELLAKIKEEADEVITAETKRDFAWEISDVLYVLSVLAVDEGIEWGDIEAELGGRHK